MKTNVIPREMFLFEIATCWPIPAFRYWNRAAYARTMDGTILQKRCREFTRCTHATQNYGAAGFFKTGFSFLDDKKDEIPFVPILLRFESFRFALNRDWILRFFRFSKVLVKSRPNFIRSIWNSRENFLILIMEVLLHSFYISRKSFLITVERLVRLIGGVDR